MFACLLSVEQQQQVFKKETDFTIVRFWEAMWKKKKIGK